MHTRVNQERRERESLGMRLQKANLASHLHCTAQTSGSVYSVKVITKSTTLEYVTSHLHKTITNVVNQSAPVFYEINTCSRQTVYTYWLWYGWQQPCIGVFDDDGIEHPDREVCGIGSCKSASTRDLNTAGC